MFKLIDELKEEHFIIRNILDKVQELGVDSEEGRVELLSLKEYILVHLKKEDQEFYPFLKSSSEDDESLKEVLNFFGKEASDVSRISYNFFEKYAEGCSGEDCVKDFEDFLSAIQQRIRKEEAILFRVYEKINEIHTRKA